MNRSRRQVQQKPFVSGGTYDSNVLRSQQQQQQVQKQGQQQQYPQQQQGFSNLQYVQQQQQPNFHQQTVEETNLKLEDLEHLKNPDAPLPEVSKELSEGEGDNMGTGSKSYFKKIFAIRKKPSVRAKEKKIRQNRRLRKVLLPKNALMALHEVKGIKIEDFVISSSPGGGFIASVSVNNNQYEGRGTSKNSAKNSACEKALRDLVITKMLQKPKSGSTDANKSDSSNDVEMKDVEDNDEDDLPMVNLASFALFKLFSEWEAEGFEIPEFRPIHHSNGNTSDGGTTTADKQEKSKKPPSIRNELPPNWEIMHPATLLCMMRPGITYVELGAEGKPPNQTQKVGVTVDDQQFIGTGRSKKVARKNAAVTCCNQLFGTNFTAFEQ